MNLAQIAAGSAALMALSVHCAVAAPALAVHDVNMRQGPGTEFPVVTTIPGGSNVEVNNCYGQWCSVTWNGKSGYAVARNLDRGEGAPPGAAGPPPAGAGAPPPPQGTAPPPPGSLEGAAPQGAPPPGATAQAPYPPGAPPPPPGYYPPPPGYYPPPPGYYYYPPGYGPYYYGPYGYYYGPYWRRRWWW